MKTRLSKFATIKFAPLAIWIIMLITACLTPASGTTRPEAAKISMAQEKLNLQKHFRNNPDDEFANLAQAFLMVQEDSEIRSMLSRHYLSRGEESKTLLLIKNSRSGLLSQIWLLVRIKTYFWILLVSIAAVLIVLSKHFSFSPVSN